MIVPGQIKWMACFDGEFEAYDSLAEAERAKIEDHGDPDHEHGGIKEVCWIFPEDFKKYTLEIQKEAFNAAREQYDALAAGELDYVKIGDSGYRPKYETFEDYKKFKEGK